MARTNVVTNIWVEVTLRSLGDLGIARTSDSFMYPDPVERMQEYERRGKEVVDQIQRHVDNVERARVVKDTEGRCEFCGSYWTEDDSEYNGGCCTEDQERHESLKTVEGDHHG